MVQRLHPNSRQILLGVVAALLTWVSHAQARSAALPEDNDISAAIQRSLSGDTMVPHERVQVSTKDGIATLSGTVPHLVAKDRAVWHAEAIKGVCAVVDRLQLQTVRRSDEELSKKFQEVLRLDPATKSLDLDVSVRNGEITF